MPRFIVTATGTEKQLSAKQRAALVRAETEKYRKQAVCSSLCPLYDIIKALSMTRCSTNMTFLYQCVLTPYHPRYHLPYHITNSAL